MSQHDKSGLVGTKVTTIDGREIFVDEVMYYNEAQTECRTVQGRRMKDDTLTQDREWVHVNNIILIDGVSPPEGAFKIKTHFLDDLQNNDNVKLRCGEKAKVTHVDSSKINVVTSGGQTIGLHRDGAYDWNGIQESQFDIVAVFSPVGPDTASKKFRVYLSGPMAGLPERNFPEFYRVGDTLRALGVEVYNPAEHETNLKWVDRENRDDFPLAAVFLDYCREILTNVDAIVILPGWENSKGVRAEKALAEVIGIPVIFY